MFDRLMRYRNQGLLLISFALLFTTDAQAWWGKYPSRIEAKDACHEWASDGGNFTSRYIPPLEGPRMEDIMKAPLGMTMEEISEPFYVTHSSPTRRCILEEDTRQFLGQQTGKKNAKYQFQKDIPPSKIVKRFRY